MREELRALNDFWPNADDCYYLELDPPHVLFNTNCPPELEYQVRMILDKYTSDHESRTQ